MAPEIIRAYEKFCAEYTASKAALYGKVLLVDTRRLPRPRVIFLFVLEQRYDHEEQVQGEAHEVSGQSWRDVAKRQQISATLSAFRTGVQDVLAASDDRSTFTTIKPLYGLSGGELDVIEDVVRSLSQIEVTNFRDDAQWMEVAMAFE